MGTQPRCPSCGLAYASAPGGGPACRCAFNFAPIAREATCSRDDLQKRLWALADVPRATTMEADTPASVRFFTPSPWPERAHVGGITPAGPNAPNPATEGGPGWGVRPG